MKKKGFTLIELIAVIAILAILAIIAVPRVITYVDRSKKVAFVENSRVIYNMARLRDLQTLINTPIDKISIDSKGNLAGKFKSYDNKHSIYEPDDKVHRVN